MKHRTPPKLATALLKRLGPSSSALVGDLHEAYQSGRSRFWYWGQVITSIGAAMSSSLHRHPIAALRAIALGLAFTWIGGRYILYDLLHAGEWLFATGLLRWFYVNGYGLPQMASWPATAMMFSASGWIVARVSRQHGASIVVAYAFVIESLVCGIGAWRLVMNPALVHPVYAVLLVGIMQTFATAVPALVGGVCAVSGRHSNRVAV
jgi:hypothetical protein